MNNIPLSDFASNEEFLDMLDDIKAFLEVGDDEINNGKKIGRMTRPVLHTLTDLAILIEKTPYAQLKVLYRIMGVPARTIERYKKEYPKIKDFYQQLIYSGIRDTLASGVAGLSDMLSDTFVKQKRPDVYLKVVEFFAQHKVAEDFGFTKQTESRFVKIEDKTKPIPNYDKDELSDV